MEPTLTYAENLIKVNSDSLELLSSDLISFLLT
jgi:hypothetical protein